SMKGQQVGVFFLRTTGQDPPLTRADAQFAETVIRTAVAAIEKAYDFETAVSDKKRLEKLAATDALTGCLNRRALSEELAAELDRARRYNLALTILLADIDRFKLVNDTRGHLAGDSVLRQVGEILRREARSVDLVARYGGEEFVVVMPETALHGSVIFAERLRRRVMHHDFADPGEDPLNLPISIAPPPSWERCSTRVTKSRKSWAKGACRSSTSPVRCRAGTTWRSRCSPPSSPPTGAPWSGCDARPGSPCDSTTRMSVASSASANPRMG